MSRDADTPNYVACDDETKAIGACRDALRDLEQLTATRIVNYLDEWVKTRKTPDVVYARLDDIAPPDPAEPVPHGLVATGEFKTDVQF